MSVQIDFWELLLALAGLVGAFATVIWAFGSLLVKQFEKRLTEKFNAIEASRKSADEALQNDLNQLKSLEREFLEFKAELPERFVLRTDYIRGQSILEAKQDALYNRMEVVRLEIAKNQGVKS